jgi:hypothetical protein
MKFAYIIPYGTTIIELGSTQKEKQHKDRNPFWQIIR